MVGYVPMFRRSGRILLTDFVALDRFFCTYCGVVPRGRSIQRPLLINGYAYLAVSLPDNGR
jgi:hypothetical protein